MKKNKLTNRTILIIALTSFAILFLSLSIITSVIKVNRTKKSIDNIGDVSLSIETEEKIDQAIVYYDKLDRNIGLEKKVKNANKLDEAKTDYVRLAIKRAIVLDNRKVADGIIRAFSRFFNQAEGSVVLTTPVPASSAVRRWWWGRRRCNGQTGRVSSC